MEIDICIPENDPARLISQFVEKMDLTEFYDTYERMSSEKYASPEIMLKLMLYAYHERNRISSRNIEKTAEEISTTWIFWRAGRLLIILRSQDSERNILQNVHKVFLRR